MGPEECRWCQVLGSQPSVAFADPMFVVLAPRGSRGRRRQLTLVPTMHVPTLADMSAEDMASFLAGVSKLIRWLKEANAVETVEVRAPRGRGVGAAREQHFHLSVRTR